MNGLSPEITQHQVAEEFENPEPEILPHEPPITDTNGETFAALSPSLSPALDPAAFSDSDGGRDLEMPSLAIYSSALDSESHLGKPRLLRKRKSVAPSGSTPTTPKPRRKSRQKSRTLDAPSEKSKNWDFQSGSGYTSTPATGKVFRNLLILEESLRQQVFQQKAMRRKYLTFLATLCCLIASISHHLYFSQRTGPLRVILQLVLGTLCMTVLLYNLSGEYQKTIVLPRRFLALTNKGLRQLNVRLVRVKMSFTDTCGDLMREFSLFLIMMLLRSLHTIFPLMVRNPGSKIELWLVLAQLRCQPRYGLSDVKLVLFPRTFSTDIREGWELYRNEFWANEGVRRRKNLVEFALDPEKKKRLKEPKDVKRKRKSSVTPKLLTEANLREAGQLSPASITPTISKKDKGSDDNSNKKF